MCGRFSLTASPEEIAKATGLVDLEGFPPRYNIAPTQPILMISINAANKKYAPLVRWGFVPSWVKEPKDFSLLVNARSETAAEKPSFKNAMRHRRTLIPASGFYEWHRPANSTASAKKQAYWIRPANGEPVFFGGIMESWASPNGSEIDSGCILTTKANKAIATIHHRMPVVIKPQDFERWLDCKNNEPKDVEDLMQPVEDDFFEAIAVSDLVNKVANSGPQVQERIKVKTEISKKPDADGEKPQLDLF